MPVAITRVKHNGVLYEVGQEVAGLTPDQTELLFKSGAIGDSAEVPEGKTETKTTEKKTVKTEKKAYSVTQSRADLFKYATDNGVEVDETMTRPELYQAIKAKLG